MFWFMMVYDKLGMIHCNLFRYHYMIMNCSLSTVITNFYKGHPPVSISTGLLLLALKHDLQNFKSEEKQIILDIIIIVNYLTKSFA